MPALRTLLSLQQLNSRADLFPRLHLTHLHHYILDSFLKASNGFPRVSFLLRGVQVVEVFDAR